MFFQPPEKGPPNSSQTHQSTIKKRKKHRQKNRKEARQVKQSLARTMSTWADNFTMAATWQLKHQVAMWKSRALALEYENKVLHDTLRQFYVNAGQNNHSARTNPSKKKKNANKLMDYEQSYTEQNSDTESDNQEVEDEDEEFELEISEEYMAFLKQNFEYRKARDERKKREAAEEKVKAKAEIQGPTPAIDRIDEFKELYGDCWQQVAALDTYLSSEFMSLCDSEKPKLWPNIPLRF